MNCLYTNWMLIGLTACIYFYLSLEGQHIALSSSYDIIAEIEAICLRL